MLTLSFRQTQAELLVRAASTVIFRALARTGCPRCALKDIAQSPRYGWTAKAELEPVGPRYVRITDLKDSKIDWETVPFCRCDDPDAYRLQSNDILFARTGATTGKTHLVVEAADAVFASYLIRVRPSPQVAAEFLYAFFQSDDYWEQIASSKEGSAQPNVNGQKLLDLVLPVPDRATQKVIAEFLQVVRRRQDGSSENLPPLPPPIPEQRRIVARIEHLAAKIAEARSLRHQAAEEAEAVCQAARCHLFGGTAQSDWFPLSDYVAEVENGKSPATEGRPAAPDEWAVLKVGAVSFGTFDERENKALPASFVPIPRLEVKPGDFIMSRANTPELVGACAVVPKIRSKLMLSDKTFRFIFRDPRHVEPAYLNQLLKSPALREQIIAGASGTSSTMKNISKEKVLNLRLPPHSLSQQRRIVAHLDNLSAKVEAFKQLQVTSSAELDALLPSILDRAFKGEL